MRLDPRTKLVIIICITTLALIYNTPGRLLWLLTGTIILLLLFRVDLSGIWRLLRKLLPLILALFLVQVVFMRGGQVILSVGPVPLITEKGLEAGASVALRIGIVCVVGLLLASSSNSRDFILGLVQWKVPYEIAFMVSVTIRFLPLLREETSNMITAVQLRGVELKKVAWREKIDLYRSLFFPIVYGITLKAQQLSLAMEARCFRIYSRRTYLRKLKLTVTDYVLIFFFVIITLVLIYV
jgi:energy-coupling factor transport system permease protein